MVFIQRVLQQSLCNLGVNQVTPQERWLERIPTWRKLFKIILPWLLEPSWLPFLLQSRLIRQAWFFEAFKEALYHMDSLLIGHVRVLHAVVTVKTSEKQQIPTIVSSKQRCLC